MTWREYGNRIQKRASDVMERVVRQHEDDVRSAFSNYVTFAEGPTTWKTSFLPHDQFLMFLFEGFSEVEQSLQSLRDVEKYLARYPYSTQGIPRHRYLSYHFEAYLNEAYILQERLKRHLTQLSRRYRQSTPANRIKQRLGATLKVVEIELASLTQPRGHHVHSGRVKHHLIDRLKPIEMVSAKGEVIEKRAVDHLFRLLRAELKTELAQRTDQTVNLLDQVAEAIASVVIDPAGEIVFPLAPPR